MRGEKEQRDWTIYCCASHTLPAALGYCLCYCTCSQQHMGQNRVSAGWEGTGSCLSIPCHPAYAATSMRNTQQWLHPFLYFFSPAYAAEWLRAFGIHSSNKWLSSYSPRIHSWEYVGYAAENDRVSRFLLISAFTRSLPNAAESVGDAR